MSPEEGLAFANRFFQAYNDQDFGTIESLFSDELQWGHHNRFKGQGKPELVAFMKQFANTAPDRAFTDVMRWAVNNNNNDGTTLVFVEHSLKGTPAVDVESFGWKAGQAVTLETTSLLVVEGGKIVEWSDYA
ncbi:SnoaL-like domain-containing protein [Cladophialophora immunda]|nr:SnoaL-like domain-containing protein [Cladophialophora immunda]